MFRAIKIWLGLGFVISTIMFAAIHSGMIQIGPERGDSLTGLDPVEKIDITIIEVKGPTTFIVEEDGYEARYNLKGIKAPSCEENTDLKYWSGANLENETILEFGEKITEYVEELILEREGIKAVMDNRAENLGGRRRNFKEWIGYIELENGTDLGEHLLRKGYASINRDGANYYRHEHPYHNQYFDAFDEALSNRRGLFKNMDG